MIQTENISKVFVVVLNWNQADLTIECLDSLFRQNNVTLEILVIDNGSVDNSPTVIRQRFPTICLIENPKNLGFAAGFNVGIQKALESGFENILLINNDTIADPNMLQILAANLPSGVGIVSPALYYASKPDLLWSIGGMINPILLEPFELKRNKLTISSRVMERDFLPSCAWLVKREVFEKVGLLDEIFFPIYYDDIDFCLRARRAGYRILLIRDAKLWHKVSQSSGGEHKPRERYLMARNGAYYFRKNMQFWQAPFIALYRLGSAILWTLRLIYKRDPEALSAYWKGLLQGWFGVFPKGRR